MRKHFTVAPILVISTLTTFAQPALTLRGTQTSAQAHPLLDYELSAKAKTLLAARATEAMKLSIDSDADETEALDLTMHDTPVLDQGRHGSCVTFAVTAAVDAALGKGDYISQLCSLALGKHLADNGYRSSGWNGATGVTILQQLMDFGVVARAKEKGCGGLDHYPSEDRYQTGQPMDLKSFYLRSERVKERVHWSNIVSANDVYDHEYDLAESVRAVKQALRQGHRVTFGTLVDSRRGAGGAMGYYKGSARPDAWMLTPQIQDDLKRGLVHSGHHMIIYGFDDSAMVHDARGHQQRGGFLVRNSWGKHAGYHGDYIMTYAHFAVMMHEANKIGELTLPPSQLSPRC